MRRLIAVAMVAALFSSTGCTGRPARSAPEAARSTPVVDTSISTIDVLFLTMMVAHTEQTLEIVRVARAGITDTQLRTLVAAIEVTETDELATMRRWLRDAGPEVAAAAARHDHSGHSDAVAGLTRLRAAPAGQVDGVLRDVLSEHQRTAADLAKAQLKAGTSERVRDLARRIAQSRTGEVELMATLPGARQSAGTTTGSSPGRA
ncbi:DUF305 domain-containing protein [Micromonospora echinofusca]|uniref:DUF305 domain-containing protein n=1 Tax=Micromonospora echinofusca TaxID=47858 RepID=A0ABS3W276_MICEH|nr:DUF305 domain-containing protein [Micromonospora echinofusca]MBO4210895.1 DUF305 domain-containing protein [Micromonospora echinofusca]